MVGEGTTGREGGRGGGAGAAGADQRAPASLGPLRQKPAGNRGAPSGAKSFGGCFSIHISIRLLARPMFVFSFLPLPLSVWCMRISAHSVSSSHPCTLLPSLPSSSLPQLKQEFHVDTLPPGATDPSLFPILNTKVQHLCLRFPVQAEEIAQKNGFETAEFNSLLLKAEKNPFFRWRVERLMEAES